MRARYGYLLVFLLPSLLFALLTGVLAVAVGAGVLWLGVYGDDTWPDSANTVLMAVGVVVAAAMFAVLATASYQFGRRREAAGGLRRAHVWVALAIAVLLPALVALRQCSLADPGPGASTPVGPARPAAP